MCQWPGLFVGLSPQREIGDGMKRYCKAVLAFGLIAGMASAASAITFSDVTITGSPTGTWSVISSGDGLQFVMPDAYVITGAKTITLTYKVAADPGFELDSFYVQPTGAVKNGTVKVDVKHTHLLDVQDDSVTTTAGSTLTALPGWGVNLVPERSTFDVTHTINLSAERGLAKLTVYTVQYTTEAVPEPASMAALAAGFGLVAARKLRRTK